MMKKNWHHGFSLLEVMVALALVAFSITSLILVQARATRLAMSSKDLSVAVQLARYQIIECKKEVEKIITTASDFSEEGDFNELGFDKFKWECHAPKFNMRTPSTAQVEKQAKSVDKDQTATKNQDTSAMSPFISLITESLGNSVRELVTIVRWKDGEDDEEIRVVTHITDLAAMGTLAQMLNQGAKQFGSKSKKQTNSKDQGNKPTRGNK